MVKGRRLGGARFVKVINSLTFRGIGSGLALLLTLSVTRYLEIPEAAAFLLLFNLTTIAAVCFRWGMDDVIVRRVASATGAAREVGVHLMRMAHRRSSLWLVSSAAVAGCVMLLPINNIPNIGLRELLVALAISSLVTLVACAGRVHQGLGRANYAAFLLNILIPGLLLIGLWLSVSTGAPVTSWGLQLTYLIVSLACYSLTVWTVSSTRPLNRLPARDRPTAADKAADRKASNRLGGVVFAQQALNWCPLLVVPLTYGEQPFTSFMVAYKLATLISLVMLAVNFTFASRLAALYSTRQTEELRRLVRLMVMSVAAAIGLASAAVFFGRRFVYSFAGVEPMDTVLILLVGAQAFFALASVYALVLAMCHDEVYLLKAQCTVASVGMVAFLTLSFTARLEFAVAAMTITYLFLMVSLGFRVSKLSKN